MKGFVGFIFFLLIAITLIELIKATILLLVILGLLVSGTGFIYILTSNTFSFLKKKKQLYAENQRLTAYKAKKEAFITRHQIEKFESGVLREIWKDDELNQNNKIQKLDIRGSYF